MYWLVSTSWYRSTFTYWLKLCYDVGETHLILRHEEHGLHRFIATFILDFPYVSLYVSGLGFKAVVYFLVSTVLYSIVAIISYDVEVHFICQLLSKFLYFINEAKTLVFCLAQLAKSWYISLLLLFSNSVHLHYQTVQKKILTYFLFSNNFNNIMQMQFWHFLSK